MSITFTIMGSGNSAGTPSVGNFWGNCDPDEPKNRRTRPSALVQSETTTIVIDTGPDFREQVNRHDVSDIDGVLYTHSHGDHIYGMDDLRIYRLRNKHLVDVYGTKETLGEMQARFEYLFIQKADIYPQVLRPTILSPDDMGKPMIIGDIEFIPFIQDHGTCKSLGFRFGNLAYSTDMVALDDKAVDILRGVENWIADGSGYKMPKNIVHCTLKELYKLNEDINAQRIYMTHLTPAMDYQTLLNETPDNYYPAYDGLSFKVQY